MDSLLIGSAEEVAQSYDGVSLVPREKSTLKSRSEADTGMMLFEKLRIELPIISSPMPDVTGQTMAMTLSNLGTPSLIHRFMSITEQVSEYIYAKNHSSHSELIGCAIGVTGDYLNRADALYKEGCRIFCLDTANGFNFLMEEAILRLRSIIPNNFFIIAGNVCTEEGYEFLADLGVNAVRVGMAGGSVCTTRTETGVYYPMASCISEVYNYRYRTAKEKTLASVLNVETMAPEDVQVEIIKCTKTFPQIIADGGIRIPADMNKALALGADLIMAGNIFAGTEESPGIPMLDEHDKKYKRYRGAASFGVQLEYTGSEPDYNEGRETFIPYKGPVIRVIKRFIAGLQSSMSMMNSRTLAEYYTKVDIINI
jgi:IMP dehydrogenase